MIRYFEDFLENEINTPKKFGIAMYFQREVVKRGKFGRDEYLDYTKFISNLSKENNIKIASILNSESDCAKVQIVSTSIDELFDNKDRLQKVFEEKGIPHEDYMDIILDQDGIPINLSEGHNLKERELFSSYLRDEHEINVVIYGKNTFRVNINRDKQVIRAIISALEEVRLYAKVKRAIPLPDYFNSNL